MSFVTPDFVAFQKLSPAFDKILLSLSFKEIKLSSSFSDAKKTFVFILSKKITDELKVRKY